MQLRAVIIVLAVVPHEFDSPRQKKLIRIVELLNCLYTCRANVLQYILYKSGGDPLRHTRVSFGCPEWRSMLVYRQFNGGLFPDIMNVDPT